MSKVLKVYKVCKVERIKRGLHEPYELFSFMNSPHPLFFVLFLLCFVLCLLCFYRILLLFYAEFRILIWNDFSITSMIDDRVLATESQSGNADSFGALYDRYCGRIFGFIYSRIGQRETAEDITSEAFHKALEKIGTYDPEKGTFSAWIYQIARNTMNDHFRSYRETQDLDEMGDVSSGEDIETNADTNLRLEKIKTFLQKLKPDQREVILLRVWDDLPFREIASITGKTEANSKMIFGRGVKKIKEAFLILLLLLILLQFS